MENVIGYLVGAVIIAVVVSVMCLAYNRYVKFKTDMSLPGRGYYEEDYEDDDCDDEEESNEPNAREGYIVDQNTGEVVYSPFIKELCEYLEEKGII